MQKNCETCWFVLGIHCSTGFEMKTFALYSELFASFSHYGTGSLIVFPLVFFANSLSKPALLPPPPPNLPISTSPLSHHHLNFLLSLLFLCSSPFFLEPNLSRLTLRGKNWPPLLLMSDACSCLSSADGCQALQSQTPCSAGVFLWSPLTNSNGLFLSGGDLS